MSLRWNLAAGVLHSATAALVGIAVVPFYLHYLGVEAYGLIGFFIAIQGLFVLLDMGLAPTMNREVARARASGDLAPAGNLLHTLAILYWAIAAAIAAAMFLAAPLIATRWLGDNSLPMETVTEAVALMGLIIACRFPVGLYLGALMGAERLVLASMIGVGVTILGNVGAVFVLAFVSPTVQAFFLWQAAAGLVYVGATWAASWASLRSGGRPRTDLEALKRVWRFSAGMGATAILATIFIHSDKIVLSKIVTLEELGRYTLAGLIARLLYLVLTPTFNAVYPRLTTLLEAGRMEEVSQLYHVGTRLLLALIFPMAAYLSIFSREIFLVWTGDASLADASVLVVAFLLLGTAFNGAMHFPYALQLAAGKSHLPVLINSILLVGFIPTLAYLAFVHGAVGGAAAWAILNGAYLFLGSWLTDREILKRGVGPWLLRDVGFPFATTLLVVGAGGIVLQRAGFAPLATLALGTLLPLAAFAAILAASPQLASMAKRLIGRAPGEPAEAAGARTSE